MKIERNIKINKCVFKDICAGDVFEFKNDYYMKTETSTNGTNVVDILTGDLYKMSDDTEIIFHRAKVIIED